MFRSATLKLTLWYVFLVMVLSVTFSGVLYHFSTRQLGEALHNQYRAMVDNDHDADNEYKVSGHELDARSSDLLQDLWYFNAVVLFGSAGVSYILARRTLRPIELAHQVQIRFTAEASHELRTPITAMKADTEATLMQPGDDPAILRATLEGNLRDIDRLEKLTDHLLEISRYRSGAHIARDSVKLDTILSEVMAESKHAIAAKQLVLDVNIEPLLIVGDSQSVRRLITIVLDNAIKYSSPKGRINVVVIAENHYAMITIQDQGMGIDSHDLEHVFEPFYRAKNAIERKNVRGYGLGLPLAKEIVELHKGTITIQSNKRKGTTIMITMPLA